MGEGRNIVAELEAEADWRRTEAETLRSEIERLRAALRSIADDTNECTPIGIVARAALEGKE